MATTTALTLDEFLRMKDDEKPAWNMPVGR